MNATPIRWLVIDPDEHVAEVAALIPVVEVCRQHDPLEALQSGAAERYEAMLFGGPQAVAHAVRAAAVNPRLPLLIVADESSEEAALEALRRGVDDYLLIDELNAAALCRWYRTARRCRTAELAAASAKAQAQRPAAAMPTHIAERLRASQEVVAALADTLHRRLDSHPESLLDAIRHETTESLRLLDDLADADAIRRQEMRICRQATTLDHIVKQAAWHARPHCRRQEVQLRVGKIAEQQTLCDESRMIRAIARLVEQIADWRGPGAELELLGRTGRNDALIGIRIVGCQVSEGAGARLEPEPAGECDTEEAGFELHVARELLSFQLADIVCSDEPAGAVVWVSVPACVDLLVQRRVAQLSLARCQPLTLVDIAQPAGEETAAMAARLLEQSLTQGDVLCPSDCGRRWLALIAGPRNQAAGQIRAASAAWGALAGKPLAYEVLDTHQLPAARQAAMQQIAAASGRPQIMRRVVLVEETAVASSALQRSLREAGYDIVAANEEHPLELLRPQAIVVDARNGRDQEALERIPEAAAGVPVIMLADNLKGQQQVLEQSARFVFDGPDAPVELLSALEDAGCTRRNSRAGELAGA